MGDLTQLEHSGYYAVIRALFACDRLESFENDELLTDLAIALGISDQQRLVFLEKVKHDQEARYLAQYGEAAPVQPPMPVVRPIVQMPHIPQYDAGHGGMSSYSAGKASKGKKAAAPAPSPKPIAVVTKREPTNVKRKSSGTAPQTPRTSQPKSTPKSGEKRLVGAAAAAVAASQSKALEKAQVDLRRLNAREREIFETLIKMGVTDEDADLNDVHKALIKWYRLDVRQREIEVELGTMQDAF